jgi:hypothetical protein
MPPHTVELDDVTWDAIQYLSKKLGIDSAALARDLLRPFVQYLRYYLVQADIAEVCKDIIDPRVINLPKVKTLDVDKEVIRRYISAPAAVLAVIKGLLGKFMQEPVSIDKFEPFLGKETLNQGLKALRELGFAEVRGKEVILSRAPEVYSRFLDCAQRLERMYGLRTLGRTLKTLSEGKG